MSVEWTGLSPELLLPLDRDAPSRCASSWRRGLREAIRAGRLAAGERLPSSRELARELGVSRGLVVECYDQLQAEGYLRRPGRLGDPGRRAARLPAAPRAAPGRPRRPAARSTSCPACPTWPSFPRDDWAGPCARPAATAASAAFDYGDPRGARSCARCWPATCGRVRGAAAEPERHRRLRRLRPGPQPRAARAGRRAGVDAGRVRGPRVRRDRPRRRRAAPASTVVRVPVDEHGLRRRRAGRDRRAAPWSSPRRTSGRPASCCRPAAPAGAGRLGRATRRDRWSRTTTTPSSATTGSPSAPCRASRRTGWSPIGTVSKSLAPALRLGWLLCPADLVAAGRATRRSAPTAARPGSTSSRWPRLIESGRFDRHLRRMRRVLRGQARGPGRHAGRARAGRRADRPRRRLPRRGRAAGRRDRGGGRRAGPGPRRRPVRDEPAALRPAPPTRRSSCSASAT